ncbi:MAG: LysR family transcriptional regulator, partial [Rhodoferax sp.]
MMIFVNATKRRGDFTLKQVRVFLAASQRSTFRQAAPMVYLSHAAFASAIQELEASLGEELFVRTGHGNQLSIAGAAFLPDALRLMDCYNTALASLGKWRDAQQCHFVLAGNNSVMPTVLRDLLDRFRGNFQTGSFEYEECTSQRVIESVRQGLADCGLCSVFVARPELHCTPLLEAPLGLLC